MPDILTAKALREQRAKLARRIREMADEANAAEGAPEVTAERQAEWHAVNAEYDAMTRRIEIAERADHVTAEQREPVGDRRIGREDRDPRIDVPQSGDSLRALALAGWLSVPSREGVTSEQADAMAAMGVSPHQRNLSISLLPTDGFQALQSRFRQHHPSQAVDRTLDYRATVMTSGAGDSGGYLIAPEQLRTSLEVNMLAFGGMRQVGETIRTATGEPLSWPTADDTGNTGTQIGETADVSNSGAGGNLPTFGVQTWYAYDFSSNMILVPKNLLNDNVFGLPSLLGQMLGERLGRITNTRMTVGTGAATITGIVTSATTYSAISATAITYDDVIKLEHSVDPAYRQMPGTGYMLHDSIMLQLRLLKDGTSNYLWKSNEPAGRPDTLNNKPFTINQDMDSTISSGKKTLLFGHLPSYKIRTVGNIELVRLDERYAEYRRVAFIAFTREDGKLLSTATARVKVLTH